MLKIYPYAFLGRADYGWLKANYHFSFARYYNPARTGFGKLLVINDDAVAPGKGFDTHAHDNMEIITYVRQGAITHKDSLGNIGRTEAGDVQVMSAGRGVAHSEYNLEDTTTTLFQIWIEPAVMDVTPRWEAQKFPNIPITSGPLPILVSGMKEHEGACALFINQDAAIYAGTIAAGGDIVQPIKHQAYILLSRGDAVIEGTAMSVGDGAELTGSNTLNIKAKSAVEMLVIDVPA